ncbi:MAG TPA: endonuclease/exonuclease/phosphatase family protein [Saprospiraceae bacterium]|nr:endonuclease/exonuclease/phosphatase family protein [Saprospiraceae bacterium]HMQ85535.1 endonuclease/exonuclease/phosphatase family protein [Saprospiraceae bacterium]
MKILSTCLLALFFAATLFSQQSYKIGCIGFYNFENLFDTLDTPDVNDFEFTPEGDNRYTPEVYREKLTNLSRVVAELGLELTPDGVALLGVSEIENRSVLEDFVQQPSVKARNYQIVHYDSPDRRGIDVGLLYNPKYYEVSSSASVPLYLFDSNGDSIFTRDILLVSGLFDGEPLHVMVNHWPSRRGGEAATQPLRNAAALKCKTIADSIMAVDPSAKVIIMGDLNDDPSSPSVREVIQAKRKKEEVKAGGFFNPMYDYYKKGIGTLAYRDAWSLFDQLIISSTFLDGDKSEYQFYKAIVHNPPYLTQKEGAFKGYPFRTYAGNTYLGGYSDHFPVYLFIIKPN